MKEKAVVLIVDDIASNVQALAGVLKDDYNIKVAVNGIRALELVKQKPYPDLVLLDVNMPDMNGYEVLNKIKRLIGCENLPVMFVTAKDTEEDEEKGLLLGAVDYIKKPIHPAIVKARVNTQITLKRQRDELIYNAVHDQLTGLHNRNYLVEEGERKFSRAIRQNDHLTIMMIDIDHFKSVNDTHGHLSGDLVLKEVASVLVQENRREDFTARFGGEEFIIVLEGCIKEDAQKKAEILRKKIEILNPIDIGVTASFGISALNKTHTSFEALIRDADSALYKAKNNGRNCVVVA